MSISSEQSRPDAQINGHTQIGEVPWLGVPPWSFERLFLHHFEAIAALRRDPRGPGYLAVAVCANDELAGHAVLEASVWGSADRTVIVGRHAQAALRLPKDPGIALRHLVVRATVGDSGAPVVRVLDLKTGQGFVGEGVGACEAIASDGCLFLHLGVYALMFFPLLGDQQAWPDDAGAAWRALPPRTVVDHRNVELVSSVIGPSAGRRDPEEISQVTVLPAVASVERQPTSQPMPTGLYGVLTLVQDGVESFYPVTEAQLERGVLLGRYSRCEIATHLLRRDDTVSRVHLLLLKEGDTVLAIDTASSNGTTIDGVAISALELPDQATIEVGSGNRLRWLRVDGDAPLPSCVRALN